MKRFLAVLLTMLFTSWACIFIVLKAPPAQADDTCTFGTFCGTLIHNPDPGYAPGILISCNLTGQGFTDVTYVYAGQSSRSKCRDVDGVYVNPGADIRCWDWNWMGYVGCGLNSTGWHKVSNLFFAEVNYFLE